jgi:hypothetical protein
VFAWDELVRGRSRTKGPVKGDIPLAQKKQHRRRGYSKSRCVVRILVANEPLAYREVISGVFKELRPHVEVAVVAPRDLDREVSRLTPHFVVCSKSTPIVERNAHGWIELYPEHGSQAILSLGGEKVVFNGINFGTLLSILDDAERLYESI